MEVKLLREVIRAANRKLIWLLNCRKGIPGLFEETRAAEEVLNKRENFVGEVDWYIN